MSIPVWTARFRTCVNVLLVSSFAIISSVIWINPANAGENWTIEIVDDGDGNLAGVMASTSIAVDSNGDVHICYGTELTDSNDGAGQVVEEIWYASNVLGNWTKSKIDSSWFGFVTGSTDIQIGSSGAVQLCYVKPSGVYYSSQTSEGWMNQQIPGSALNDAGGTASIGLDYDGAAHIFFSSNNVDMGVKHARLISGEWQMSTMTAGTDFESVALAFDRWDGDRLAFSYTNSLCAITADTSGIVHVVYVTPDIGSEPDKLMYISMVNGSWRQPAVEIDNGRFFNFFDPNIAVDSRDNIHIAYTRTNNNSDTLVHSKMKGDKWESSVVTRVYSDSGWMFILSPSLALDSNGKPYISYWLGSAPEGVEGGLFLATYKGPSSQSPELVSVLVRMGTILPASAVAIILWRRTSKTSLEDRT